ncbi:MAG TPA: glycosyltransferase [Flavobacterium sp.]|nr:glycosyltransferase [Flavobacterium sp.]
MQNHTPKICLIGHSLATGGAERAMAALSRFFSSRGIVVHVVTVVDNIQYPFDGELLNLGKCESRLQKFRTLYKYLRQDKFDFIIDFRMRPGFFQEWLTARFLYNAPTVYAVHSAKIDWYLPKSVLLARLIYGGSYRIVTVSKGIEDLLEPYGLPLTAIPNPIDFDQISRLSMETVQTESFILAVGRMDDDVKQFDKLIRAYADSDLPFQNIRLVILRDGKHRQSLKQLAAELNVPVSIDGAVANPYPWFKNARFTVLCSKTEGLPTVLLESLACGTPVVSFDCKTGPAEIVRDGENGMLVPDQDFEALTHAMNWMAQNEEFREACRQDAFHGLEKFHLENVGRAWLELLKIDLY